ncbi:hypothetical protein B0A49_04150 [Cryomyces minteri]|uniref:Uncharacterized protein n=1 Tax=Cryomyces minteri TaxID=331657 RepID=A0A4U0X6A3_9PEZI|nr:hypothetical protein B0A49_04150 [Cryomyces minteri]
MSSKLKKLFHKKEPESPPSSKQASKSSPSSPTSPVRATDYGSASQGQPPTIGHRPLGQERSSLQDDTIRSRTSTGSRTQGMSQGSPRRASAEPSRVPVPGGIPSSALGTGNHARQLPHVPHESDLSTDLQHLTLGQRYSEDVANRNIEVSKRGQYQSKDPVSATPGGYQPLTLRHGRHSEDVADWNIVKSTSPISKEAVPAPLSVSKKDVANTLANSQRPPIPEAPIASGSPRQASISRKPFLKINLESLRDNQAEKRSLDNSPTSLATHDTRGASVNKALPVPPVVPSTKATSRDTPLSSQTGINGGGSMIEEMTAPPSLKGVVDLTNTEDTTVHERWAPAVTHEKIHRRIHHIREEQITREIHYHDVYHRILPVIDVEVLPARHFVPAAGGGFLEIAEDQVPTNYPGSRNWVIMETVSKIPSDSRGPFPPRQFSAKSFEGTEGDYKEYITPEGFTRTETTWVHPPTLDTTEYFAKQLGPSVPFHFGHRDPAKNGLQFDILPAAVSSIPSSAVKPMGLVMAEGRVQNLDKASLASGPTSSAPVLPPVPPHQTLNVPGTAAATSNHHKESASLGSSSSLIAPYVSNSATYADGAPSHPKLPFHRKMPGAFDGAS